ncbi:hypothetical protein OsI_37680 [Oryza sativa Indica Group]|uniref:Uncharacterized protein n=1 Tax=Oryza sativa subsp. indica TaxID=39946 RepID=B8BNG3_ORYSI|nr:hypothetical protein OsI_37680 [Oryza sativa Indica Group]
MENLNECINSEELVDIDIPNRCFTWSNKRRNPTLVKLDRVFINILWSQSFPHTEAKAITASTSDDTPILVQTSQSLPINKIFRLENYWLHMPGFKNMIQTDWARGTRTLSPISILNLKLRRLRAKIRSWSKNKTAIQSLLHINKHVIDFLDCCEEWRPLSALEFTLRAHCTNHLKELNWFWTLKWKRRAKIKCILLYPFHPQPRYPLSQQLQQASSRASRVVMPQQPPAGITLATAQFLQRNTGNGCLIAFSFLNTSWRRPSSRMPFHVDADKASTLRARLTAIEEFLLCAETRESERKRSGGACSRACWCGGRGGRWQIIGQPH